MGSVSKQGLLTAYRRLLKPLVRILIRNGVTYGEFAEAAKLAYIDSVCEDDFLATAQPTPDQVSALTGMPADEVERLLRKRTLPEPMLTTNLDHLVGLIHEWNTSPEFTGPYGIPLELKFSGSTERPSFSDLVRRHFPQSSPDEVLQDLLKTGTLIETEPGWYRVLVRAYQQEADSAESIEAFIRSTQTYIEVLDHNIRTDTPSQKMFEREVYTERGIRPENLPRFKRFFGSKAQQLLEEIDNWIALLEPPNEDNGIRTGLSIFHYVRHEENTSKND